MPKEKQARLRDMEVAVMSPENYEPSCGWRWMVFMELKTCSEAILGICNRHGKSPCFSGLRVLKVAKPDWLMIEFGVVDGGFFLD